MHNGQCDTIYSDTHLCHAMGSKANNTRKEGDKYEVGSCQNALWTG